MPDYVVEAPKSGSTMNRYDFFSETSLRVDVSQFIQGSIDLIGDTVSGCLAQRIKKDEFLHSFGPMEIFALHGLSHWLHLNVEN